MRAVPGDVISTTDGRYGTVRTVIGGDLTVETLPVLDLDDSAETVAGEVFFINQAQVASIR